MIRYNSAFTENVQGALAARFLLDQNGEPKAGEEDDTTFYYIQLNLLSKSPANIEKVTYLLDEASYWEPERESKNRKSNFAETITSYGDYLIRVEVEMKSGRFVQQALLSEMLEEGHKDDSSAKIKDAIAYIREN